MDTKDFVTKLREEVPETSETAFIANIAPHYRNVIIIKQINEKISTTERTKLFIKLCWDITNNHLKADNTEVKIYQDGTLRFTKSDKIADEDLKESLEKFGVDYNPTIAMPHSRGIRA